MTSRSAIAGAIVAVLSAVTITACGDDEPANRAADTTRAAPAPETSPTTTGIPTETNAPRTTEAAPNETPTTTTAAPDPTTPPVFEFLVAEAADGWQVVNDTVMGGVSIGELTWSAGILTFAGELSLANNGGFASIRSPQIDPGTAVGWAARPGIRVEVDGDGRTWTLALNTDGDSGGWITTFPTGPDGTTTVELPWASFEPVTRFLEPRPTSDPLDPARLVTVAFFLVDGVEGSFRLGLRSIG